MMKAQAIEKKLVAKEDLKMTVSEGFQIFAIY